MYYQRFRHPSKNTIFALLMLGSAAALLLPGDLFRPARGMTQLIAVAQLGMRETARGATEKIESLANPPIPLEQQGKILLEKQALENEVVWLRQQLARLEATNQALTAIRGHPSFPPGGRLISARVIALDADAWREAFMVAKGTSRRVREGDWVAARLHVNVGTEEGVRQACQVLARECLIGWVEQAHRWTARVVLLSDPFADKAIRVCVVRASKADADGSPAAPPRVFVLKGMGHGRMQILDVPKNDVEAGHVRVGDLVVTDPDNPEFPLAMTVGRVVELRHNKSKPLYFDAVVEHRGDPKALSEVLIVDLGGDMP